MTVANEITSTVKANQQAISFTGDVTIFQVDEFKQKIKLKSVDAEHLVLDLKQVESMDCAGVQLLMVMAKTLREDNQPPPTIVHGSQSQEVFDLLNLNEHFYWDESLQVSTIEGVHNESRTSH